jgi:hypothetical protein
MGRVREGGDGEKGPNDVSGVCVCFFHFHISSLFLNNNIYYVFRTPFHSGTTTNHHHSPGHSLARNASRRQGGGGTRISNQGSEGGGVRPKAEKIIVTSPILMAEVVVDVPKGTSDGSPGVQYVFESL